jgi:hypothetical protein
MKSIALTGLGLSIFGIICFILGSCWTLEQFKTGHFWVNEKSMNVQCDLWD